MLSGTNAVFGRSATTMAWIVACSIASVPVRCLADAQGDGDPLTTRFVIDDADPESKVPSAKEAMSAPLQMGYWIMLVSDRADSATKRGDLAAAVKYYRAIAKATPDRAVGFRKMCVTYEAIGDWKSAVTSCQAALEKGGVNVDDHQRFVRLLLSKQAPLTPAEIADADAVIAHVQQELTKPPAADADPVQSRAQMEGSKVVVERLKCQLGARLQDSARLEACSGALRSLAPRDPSTLAFAFTLALVTHDFAKAENVIAGAKQSGLNDKGVALMQSKLRAELERRPLLSRVLGSRLALGLTSALVAALIALALLARRGKHGLRLGL